MAPIRFRSILSLIIRWLGIAVRWFAMCLLHELAKQLAVCLVQDYLEHLNHQVITTMLHMITMIFTAWH